jgi:AbrB family looped-hinge helix DNA binding protein
MLAYSPVLPNLTEISAMETTRLSSKGQLILPKPLRDAHHWKPGTEFEIEDRPDGILLRPKKQFPRTELQDVLGCAGYTGKAKSLEEMEEAIAKGIRERDAGG